MCRDCAQLCAGIPFDAKAKFSCYAEFHSSRKNAAVRTLPPLTALRAFEAAARLLSFQDAAKELALTPTAISHQVRLLEDYCGRPLFQRRPRPLSLTQTGARLLPAISQGLDLFAEGLALASDMTNKRLRVTATNAFAARWIMPRMPTWRQAHPDIGLDIMGTDHVLDLTADEIDIAIRYARQPPKGMICTEIGRDRYILVASWSQVWGSSGQAARTCLRRTCWVFR